MLIRRVLVQLSISVALGAAYGQSTFSTIVGAVRDPLGDAVPSAAVTATALDSGASSSTSTNEQGVYEFANVRAGRYRLAAAKPAFAGAVSPRIEVRARDTVRIDLVLEIAVRTEAARVTGAASLIQSETATVADTKTLTQIDRLPANYRAATVGPILGVLRTLGRAAGVAP